MRRRRTLAWALVLLAACTGSDDDARPATTTSAPSAAEVLEAHLAEQPSAVVQSPVVRDAAGDIAAIGLHLANDSHRVQVVSLDDAATVIARLVLPPPSFDFLSGSSIDAADLTGDGNVDFLVHLMAASSSPGVVVSRDGGTWRVLTTSDDPDDVYIGRDARVDDGRLRSTFNDCTPTCAEGTNTEVTWRYDRERDELVEV